MCVVVIEDAEQWEREFLKQMIQHEGGMDRTVEDWLDSEYNRIFVLYAYTDVTSIN